MVVFHCVMLVKIPKLMKITLRFHLDINKNTQHSGWKHIPQSVISLGILELLSEEVCDTDSLENNLCKVGKQGTAQPDAVNNPTKTSGCERKTKPASKRKRGKRQQRQWGRQPSQLAVSF